MTRRVFNAFVVAALVVAALISCSSTRTRRHKGPPQTTVEEPGEEQTTQALRVGMTSAEVRQAWGEPRDTTTSRDDPDTEVWVYERRILRGATGGSMSTRAILERILVTLTFKQGTLTHIDEKPL